MSAEPAELVELVGPIEAAVERAWREVLEIPSSARDAAGVSFTRAGGHSLAAARLAAAIRQRAGVDVPVVHLLGADPTLAELQRFAAGRAAGASAPGAAPTTLPTTTSTPVPEHTAGGSAPLPSGPRAMWTAHRLFPRRSDYNVLRVLTIEGRCTPHVLRDAIRHVAGRHDALAAAVIETAPGSPEVVIGPPVAPPLVVRTVQLDQPVQDGAEPPPGADWRTWAPDEVRAAVEDLRATVLPIDRAPLWRVGLVWAPRLRRSWLAVSMHHVISDLRASDIVLADLAAAYDALLAGRSPVDQAPAPSLLDYLDFETQRGRSAATERDLSWWTDTLRPAVAEPRLPLSRAAGATRGDAAPAVVTRALSGAETERLDRVAHELGVTPTTVVLAATRAVLGAWSDRPAVIGVASMRLARPQDQDLVGFLVDTLPVVGAGDAGEDLARSCRRARDDYLAAVDRSAATFADAVTALRPPRSTAASPYLDLWFNDLTRARCPATFGGDPCAEYDPPPTVALFPLAVYLRRAGDGYRFHLVAAADGLSHDDAAAFLDQIIRLTRSAPASTDQPVAALLAEPARPGAGSMARPAAADPMATVASTVDAIAAHAARRPDAPALVDEHGRLSYRELHELIEHRRSPASGPAVLDARRDRDHVLDLLAHLADGTTTVLVDANWPAAQRQQARRAPVPARGVHVMFTSGTAAATAGVVVDHAVRERCLDDLHREFSVRPDDVWAFLGSPAHDPAWRDSCLPLRAGGTLRIPPSRVFADPGLLVPWLRDSGVTVLGATPFLLNLAFGLSGGTVPSLRLVVSGGAGLTAAAARRIRATAPAATLVNGYGCTETPQLVACSVLGPDGELPPWDHLPVGRPLPGRRVEIRTSCGTPCQVGQVGVLWVAEPHIALGYLTGGGRAPAFTEDAGGVRWFRTGDLACRDARGDIHLLGRADRQVPVNGHRVSLDGIEAEVRALDGVAGAAAEVVRTGHVDALRVWVEPAAGAELNAAAVRAELSRRLPAEWLPTVRLAALDRTANHKPRLPAGVDAPAVDAAEPAPVDGRVAALAAQVVGHPVDPTANLFDAGFTSISLLQFIAELDRLVGIQVNPLDAFRHPTLGRLLTHLSVAATAPTGNTGPPPPVTDRRAFRQWARRPSGNGHNNPAGDVENP